MVMMKGAGVEAVAPPAETTGPVRETERPGDEPPVFATKPVSALYCTPWEVQGFLSRRRRQIRRPCGGHGARYILGKDGQPIDAAHGRGPHRVQLWNGRERWFGCAYGKEGRELLVAEPWNELPGRVYQYQVSNGGVINEDRRVVWRQARFMPSEACRILVAVNGVRLEHVQAISGPDLDAECCGSREEFAARWDQLQARAGGGRWEKNPVVWVLTLRVLRVQPGAVFFKGMNHAPA